MISLPQIRAARGLLNWTQKELAQASGLSLRTLNSIEKGDVVPRLDTLIALQIALEAQNILFTEDNGVKVKGERLDIQKYEGETVQEILMKDVVQQLRKTGGVCYTNGVNEAKYRDLPVSIVDQFYADCFKYGIVDYVAVERGFSAFLSRPSHYKWISRESLGKLAYSIYGDTISFIIWEKTPRIVIIRNKTIADHFLNNFLSIWKNAEIPPFNRHLKKFEPSETPWTKAQALAMCERIKKMGYT